MFRSLPPRVPMNNALFEESSDGWTLIQSGYGIADSVGYYKPTWLSYLSIWFAVSPGAQQAFYIRLDDDTLMHKEGNTEGEIIASDANLRIFAGNFIRAFGGGKNSPRQWSGTIEYSTSSPTLAPTLESSHPTVNPSLNTKGPTLSTFDPSINPTLSTFDPSFDPSSTIPTASPSQTSIISTFNTSSYGDDINRANYQTVGMTAQTDIATTWQDGDKQETTDREDTEATKEKESSLVILLVVIVSGICVVICAILYLSYYLCNERRRGADAQNMHMVQKEVQHVVHDNIPGAIRGDDGNAHGNKEQTTTGIDVNQVRRMIKSRTGEKGKVLDEIEGKGEKKVNYKMPYTHEGSIDSKETTAGVGTKGTKGTKGDAIDNV